MRRIDRIKVIAAFAVPAIPAVASKRGWCHLKRLAAAAAVAMTVYSAYSAYTAGQANTSLASQTVNLNYEMAKAKETRANEVLTRIKVEGSVKELGAMAAQADAKLADAGRAVEKACKKSGSDACMLAKAEKKTADGEAKLAHERAGQAEARDKAEADLAAAQAEAKGGRIAERQESGVLTLLSIVLTQLVALLSGEAFAMIGAASAAHKAAGEAADAAKPRKPAAPAPKQRRHATAAAGQRHAPANAQAFGRSVAQDRDGARRRAEGWRGPQGLQALRGRKQDHGELRSILAQVYGDALTARNSGYVVKGVQLPTAAPA